MTTLAPGAAHERGRAIANAYDTTPLGQRWFAKAAISTTAQVLPGQLIDIASSHHQT